MAAISSRPLRTPSRGEPLGSLRLHGPIAALGVAPTASVHLGWLGWLADEARVVAVKRLHPLHGADEVAVARVVAEARRARRVVHPNVVAMLGLVSRAEGLLAVMDQVPGASLEELREASGGTLDPRAASAIFAGALRGLHAAHEARGHGILREVSARRVLIAEDGVARLLDFSAPLPSTPEAALAKLPYAAPEQLLRQHLDARRDVYTASVVLWETLTGRTLFRAASPAVTLRRILGETVPPPSLFAPGIDRALDAIVLRGLARDPAARFASSEAMASELERAAGAGPSVSSAIGRTISGLACVARRRAAAESVRAAEERLCTSSAADGI